MITITYFRFVNLLCVLMGRDVVTFLSVEGPNKWARGQTWGGQPCVYYRLTLIQPKTWGVPGPPGPLGDYIPVKSTGLKIAGGQSLKCKKSIRKRSILLFNYSKKFFFFEHLKFDDLPFLSQLTRVKLCTSFEALKQEN